MALVRKPFLPCGAKRGEKDSKILRNPKNIFFLLNGRKNNATDAFNDYISRINYNFSFFLANFPYNFSLWNYNFVLNTDISRNFRKKIYEGLIEKSKIDKSNPISKVSASETLV